MADISTRKRGEKWYYSFEVASVDGKRKRIERVGGKTKKEALENGIEAFNFLKRATKSSPSTSEYSAIQQEVFNILSCKYSVQPQQTL